MMSSSKRFKAAREVVIDRFLASVDVWQAMFEMLSVKGRIRVEMTNKRLGMLMLTCWKRISSFDAKCELMSYIPSMKKRGRKNHKKLLAPLIAVCVNRIGDGLRSLTVNEKPIPITVWSKNLGSIGEACTNVETINLDVEYSAQTFDIPFESFSRLKTITVSGDTAGEDYIARASASVFLSIPPSIEVIRGLWGGNEEEEHFENAAQMEGFFAHRPSLREIDLGNLFTRDKSEADIFRVIAERCPHLKSIKPSYSAYIDYSGAFALESMKALHIPSASIDEMEIVTICERSPLVEDLQFRCRFSSNLHLQSAALNALGSLTKLADLHVLTNYGDVVAPSLMTEFVRGLARNSGASLRRLHLDDRMPLLTVAIEALDNGCPKLRYVEFGLRVGEAEPASIRFLIDSIVAHPSWITQMGEPTLVIKIWVSHDGGDEAAFEALADLAANLPSGVELRIR